MGATPISVGFFFTNSIKININFKIYEPVKSSI